MIGSRTGCTWVLRATRTTILGSARHRGRSAIRSSLIGDDQGANCRTLGAVSRDLSGNVC